MGYLLLYSKIVLWNSKALAFVFIFVFVFDTPIDFDDIYMKLAHEVFKLTW